MVPVFIQGQHLHRDVPRGRVLLQMVEHGPAQHVGQEYVERHGRRVVLAGQSERFRSAHGHEHLESLVAGQITQDARIVRVIFNDQQDGVVGLQVVAVVRDAARSESSDTRTGESSWRGRQCGLAVVSP